MSFAVRLRAVASESCDFEFLEAWSSVIRTEAPTTGTLAAAAAATIGVIQESFSSTVLVNYWL